MLLVIVTFVVCFVAGFSTGTYMTFWVLRREGWIVDTSKHHWVVKRRVGGPSSKIGVDIS